MKKFKNEQKIIAQVVRIKELDTTIGITNLTILKAENEDTELVCFLKDKLELGGVYEFEYKEKVRREEHDNVSLKYAAPIRRIS